jgi:hypothetical protein
MGLARHSASAQGSADGGETPPLQGGARRH